LKIARVKKKERNEALHKAELTKLEEGYNKMIEEQGASYQQKIKQLNDNHRTALNVKNQEISSIKEKAAGLKNLIQEFTSHNRQNLQNLRSYYQKQCDDFVKAISQSMQTQSEKIKQVIDHLQNELLVTKLEIDDLKLNEKNLTDIIETSEAEHKENTRKKDTQIENLHKEVAELEKSSVKEKLKTSKDVGLVNKSNIETQNTISKLEANIEDYKKQLTNLKNENEASIKNNRQT